LRCASPKQAADPSTGRLERFDGLVIVFGERIILEDTMTRSSATINGYEIAYSFRGDQHRPVVVLSHALATSMDIWAYQLPLLAHRFRVLLYDLRGHGGSAAPGDSYTMRQLASDLAALLDHLKISRTAFVGLSIGGMVGQVFALEYPDKLSGLVLCSTGSRTEQQAKATIEERINKVRAEGLKSQVPSTLTRWFNSKFIEEAPATMAWVTDLILATSVDGYTGCCRALQDLDITDTLSEIQVKTLIIPGEHDLAFPEKVSRVIQQKIANADLIPLRGAAHLGNVEQPHLFNEILLDFLGRIPT
jgi:3-oxoadipate enol-lactonase